MRNEIKNIKTILEETINILETTKTSKDKLLQMYDNSQNELVDYKNLHDKNTDIIKENNEYINKLILDNNNNKIYIDKNIQNINQLNDEKSDLSIKLKEQIKSNMMIKEEFYNLQVNFDNETIDLNNTISKHKNNDIFLNDYLETSEKLNKKLEEKDHKNLISIKKINALQTKLDEFEIIIMNKNNELENKNA